MAWVRSSWPSKVPAYASCGARPTHPSSSRRTPPRPSAGCSGAQARRRRPPPQFVSWSICYLSARAAATARSSPYWPFETNYNDHFETPQEAYADVLPLLAACAKQAHGDGAGLETLRVYDPYYCQGAMQRALAALGCARDKLINENRDFYADVAAGTLPSHDVLLTNPPYSADHKQRLLAFLLAQQGILSQPSTAGQGAAGRGAAGSALSGSGGNGDGSAANTNSAAGGAAAGARPFLLLVPAWMAATDYWAAFVAALGRSRADAAPAAAPAEGGKRGRPRKRVCRADAAERRAGVFYISPCERCAAHPSPLGALNAHPHPTRTTPLHPPKPHAHALTPTTHHAPHPAHPHAGTPSHIHKRRATRRAPSTPCGAVAAGPRSSSARRRCPRIPTTYYYLLLRAVLSGGDRASL